ncbi:hypothetical protein TWF696_008493 [Orbilia brochopaga]|uniref:Uncharacterized protein n=1 Tax=Orbilia brochopaga TaxID=3140254 RepID=A0AAV9UH34_9PEZI
MMAVARPSATLLVVRIVAFSEADPDRGQGLARKWAAAQVAVTACILPALDIAVGRGQGLSVARTVLLEVEIECMEGVFGSAYGQDRILVETPTSPPADAIVLAVDIETDVGFPVPFFGLEPGMDLESPVSSFDHPDMGLAGLEGLGGFEGLEGLERLDGLEGPARFARGLREPVGALELKWELLKLASALLQLASKPLEDV